MSDAELVKIALKNLELLNGNISRLSSYIWIIKGWVVTAWAALYALSSNQNKKTIVFYFIVAMGFLLSEMIRMLEKKNIDLMIQHERALNMAMLGDMKDLRIKGFSTNVKKVSTDEFLQLMGSERFSLSRAFYILAFLGTFIFCTWFF